MVYQTKKRLILAKEPAIWQLIVMIVLVGLLMATLLRMNNVRMIERKEAVIAADKSGDVDALQNRLYDLQEYVFKHMNASTGQIFLETAYRNKIDQLINQAKNATPNPAGQNAYKIAAEVCDKKFRGYSQAYAECFLAEVDKHKTSIDQVREVAMPNPNLYIKNFQSPGWSPDLAGWVVLIWLGLVFYLGLRVIFWLSLNLLIKLK